MTNMEWDFLKDQRGQRKMYCEDFVDQKWMKTMERRRRDMQALDRMREDAEREKQTSAVQLHHSKPVRSQKQIIKV